MLERWLSKSDSMFARCVRAGSWVAFSSIGSGIIRAVRVAVLTYLIAPKDFGVLFLVWSVMALLQELSETGVQHALIQNPNALEDKYLHCGWWINFFRNLLLAVLLFILAPVIANQIYEKPHLTGLLRLSCVVFLFEGVRSVSPTMLRKQMKFKRIAYATLVSNLAGLAGAVGFAWYYRDARGVVLGEIVAAGVMAVISYVIHPYRPRLFWDRQAGLALLHFGKMVYLDTVLNVFGDRLDIFVLGFLLAEETALGIYGLAKTVILMPCAILSMFTVAVGFPAISMVQDDIYRVRRGTSEIIKATQLVSIPGFIVLYFLADEVVQLLPDRYSGISEPMGALCIFGVFQVFLREFTPTLYALKRVYWIVVRSLIYVVLTAGLVVWMFDKGGIMGVCWAVNISMAVSTVFLWLVTMRVLGWRWRGLFDDMKVLWHCLAVGALGFGMALLVLLITGHRWQSNSWIEWTCLGAGLIAYGGWSWREHVQERLRRATDG